MGGDDLQMSASFPLVRIINQTVQLVRAFVNLSYILVDLFDKGLFE
jgi:hypothetical protein